LAGGVTSDADLTAFNLAASVRDGDHVVVPRLGETSPSPSGGGIDLNRASASELESLPGVGPVLAGRIVTFRDEHGRFSEVEDLLDVPGIGEAKLDQMRGAIAAP
jgi:competence protein ComEA